MPILIKANEIVVNERLDVGLALRKLRITNGYSQQVVANHFKISRNAYIDWERNKVNLSVQHCSSVCHFYGIKLSEFVSKFLE